MFTYVFNRADIFSFTDFLPKIFTLPGSLWCFLSNQGFYFEFDFYEKSLNQTQVHDEDTHPGDTSFIQQKKVPHLILPQFVVLLSLINRNYSCMHAAQIVESKQAIF